MQAIAASEGRAGTQEQKHASLHDTRPRLLGNWSASVLNLLHFLQSTVYPKFTDILSDYSNP